ncbi:MAG: hypothetical protein ACSW8A_05150 [Lachnospiraceae bacterium]
MISDFKTRYPNLHYHITSGDTEQTTLYIAWNRYQAFTPIAERFLQQLKESLVLSPE